MRKRALRTLARLVSWGALTGVGIVHLVWASGSPWPARNQAELASAVVGGDRVPSTASCAAVGAGAVITGAVTGGALGEGRAVVGLRRMVGLGLLARAAVGGGVALDVLGLPAPSDRFRELDKGYYRPLFAVLGIAVLIGAQRQRRKREQD